MLKFLTTLSLLSFTLMASANFEAMKSFDSKAGLPKQEFQSTKSLNALLEVDEKDGIQDFFIHNRSSHNICNVYVSPDYAGTWEEDVLGTSILRSGSSIRITMNGYGNHCMFDVRVRTCSGITLDRRLNLCQVVNYNIDN